MTDMHYYHMHYERIKLKNASGEVKARDMVARPDVVTKVRKLAPGNGKPKAGFEGGQTTILKKFPKRGFVNPNRKTYAAVNLDRLQHWVDQGRLHSTPEKPITAKELLLSGCVHNVHDGIKLLGNGAEFLKAAVHITPSRASKSAIKAIEASGGSVFCQYYNSLALRDCIKSRTDRVSAAPTRRNDISAFLELFGDLAYDVLSSLVYPMAKSRLPLPGSSGENASCVGTMERVVKATSRVQDSELFEKAYYSTSILSGEILRVRE
ncbi:ribosomal protein L18e/L15P [Lanmaoa asiatica]|nr:ribosomal protein L18e/L15P [Lanmaoa asiatica]